jgi:hypothetical protein
MSSEMVVYRSKRCNVELWDFIGQHGRVVQGNLDAWSTREGGLPGERLLFNVCRDVISVMA